MFDFEKMIDQVYLDNLKGVLKTLVEAEGARGIVKRLIPQPASAAYEAGRKR